MAASTTSLLGRGTTLGYSTTTPAGTYTPLTNVKSVSPNITLGEVENVVLSSTFKSYLSTLPEAECDLTIQHIPGDAGFIELMTLVTSGAIVHWQIKTTDLSTVTFDGFLKGYNPTFENEAIVEGDLSMRLTSMPVFA